jgi:phosphoribosylformylglycinamidine synthase subunit PurL
VEQPEDLVAVSKFLMAHPNIASKQWVYNQYDSMVGTVNMSTNTPSDAAIVNIKGTKKAIALTIDCNARYVNADPEVGCAIAVSEAARNIVFTSAIKGMGAACIKFETPVTGGNVSFYNQSSYEGPVFPTPTIGMLGILKDKSKRMTLNFKNENDSIYLIGSSKDCISSSEYLYSYHKIKNTPAPTFNLDEEFEVQKAVKMLIKEGIIQSAHDCADGGLFITLLESAMPNNLGFDIGCDESVRKDAFLFGEAQSRVVVSVKKTDEDKFIDLMMSSRAEFEYLGDVKGKEMIIDEQSFGTVIEAKNLFDTSLGELLK